MQIYPAIDVKDGRCVRLIQGDYAQVIEFGDDPVEVARVWYAAGAEWLHVVDLDGARTGAPQNGGVIRGIREAIPVRLQVGGGLRSIESVGRLLDDGVDRIVLGTAALNDQELVREAQRRWPGRISVALDTREGRVAAEGWLSTSKLTPRELLLRLAELGVTCFIYTDISRDGMLAGPNLAALRELIELAHAAGAEMIASGGVSSLADVANLSDLGADGAIIGRALYTGNVDLSQAIDLARSGVRP